MYWRQCEVLIDTVSTPLFQMSLWSAFLLCDKMKGIKMRERVVTQPSFNGGTACGILTEYLDCAGGD